MNGSSISLHNKQIMKWSTTTKKLQIISIKEMQKNLQKIFPYKNIVEGEKITLSRL